MTAIDLLVGGYRMAHQMISATCADLTPDEFRHQPVPGSNSTAWIVGHLALTARRTAERLGATGLPEVSEEFVGRFRTTRKPADTQLDLGEKTELLSLFNVCIEKLMEALRGVPVETLAGPTPPAGPFATNLGEGLLFGVMHVTLHCGQISTIRRSLGKPPMV